MQLKKVLFAIIIGLILFITDMLYGWISVALGGIWTLFILVLIVGILAGDISGGFIAGLLTEIIGVGLLAMSPAIFFPEVTITATDIFGRMWLVMSLSISYRMRFPDAPIPWIEGIAIIVLLVVLAPLVYAMSLFFALFGGLIGRFIHPRVFKPKEAPAPVPSQEPRPSVPPPSQEEPMEDTSLPEEESAFEEEPEEGSYTSDLESSEQE
ncbi:MAG: hypothetical protein ACFFDD_02965 [Promethearchaeota archaeon]